MYDSTQDTLKTELVRIANALESIAGSLELLTPQQALSPSYPQIPSWVVKEHNA